MVLSSIEALEIIKKSIDDFVFKTKPLVIAIDGRSASGKTTFASLLNKELNAQVIHTDDFFRPRNKNGELEISEFDGNFDIKRFKDEAVNGILSNEAFECGILDCSKGVIYKTVRYVASQCFVVEGAYSLNPKLGDYADIKVFFDVERDVQESRISSRNGKEMYDIFKKIWIPAEERYLSHYNIISTCDLIVNTTTSR